MKFFSEGVEAVHGGQGHVISRMRIHLFVLVCWVAGGSAVLGDAAQACRDLVTTFVGEGKVPGMAVTVARQGRVVWSEGFGYADLEQRVPVWPAVTRFRVGSISKPMTAYAVALLYQRGQLDLDAVVQVYVPTFPKKRADVTTRLLAGHLAGIRHYRGEEVFSRRRYLSVHEGLGIFRDDPLVHLPGEAYLYSSYGWNLISAVVEGASGRGFLEIMREDVFGALGMRHSGADHLSEIIPNRTRYYVLNDGNLENAPEVDNSYKWAGGGFLSTTEDMVRFAHAHLYPTELKSETVALLWRSQKDAEGVPTNYGLGWASGEEHGSDWVGHNGGSVGGSTRFRIYLDQKIVVALVANRTGVDFGDLSWRLANEWKGE